MWSDAIHLEINAMFDELAQHESTDDFLLYASSMEIADRERVREYMRDERSRRAGRAQAWRDSERERRNARMREDPEFAAALRAQWREAARSRRAARRAERSSATASGHGAPASSSTSRRRSSHA